MVFWGEKGWILEPFPDGVWLIPRWILTRFRVDLGIFRRDFGLVSGWNFDPFQDGF